MGKFSELDMVIKDLRNVTTAINDVANTLAEMFITTSADEAPVVATPAEPTGG